jgi:hypothetical protein
MKIDPHIWADGQIARKIDHRCTQTDPPLANGCRTAMLACETTNRMSLFRTNRPRRHNSGMCCPEHPRSSVVENSCIRLPRLKAGMPNKIPALRSIAPKFDTIPISLFRPSGGSTTNATMANSFLPTLYAQVRLIVGIGGAIFLAPGLSQNESRGGATVMQAIPRPPRREHASVAADGDRPDRRARKAT